MHTQGGRSVSHDSDQHRRRSIRLPGFDYASFGAYYVTICTAERELWLAEIVAGVSLPTACGDVVMACWRSLPSRFAGVELDASVVMPNHLHAVLWLPGRDAGGVTLGQVIRAFKAVSARTIRQEVAPSFGWQRNYYEHIIRDDDDLARVREYIADNPARWEDDDENPERSARRERGRS